MKRVGNLMPLIADKANLQEAFLRAARGKSCKKEVMAFRNHLDKQLEQIKRLLLEGEYVFGNYMFFTIYDPKKRVICAASFSERVVFHAMMRICHPVFDNYQIYDSYASRKGKGQYMALKRAQKFCRKYKWFAKLDVCKFFDSIDHSVMLSQLCRLFKDKQLLLYFRDLLDTYETNQGKGLPIGNLTSQYFANHYLATADHYSKEKLNVSGMVRYMDDVLFFAETKERLMNIIDNYCIHVKESLNLDFHLPVINKTCHGIPFLGYVVYSDSLRLNERSRKRFINKITKWEKEYEKGEIAENKIVQRVSCLFAFIDKADTINFKHHQYNMGRYS